MTTHPALFRRHLPRLVRGGDRPLQILCLVASITACSKTPAPTSDAAAETETRGATASEAADTPAALSSSKPTAKAESIRFDDCTVFRADERYTQWRCRPRGLFVFPPDATPQVEGSQTFADVAARTLATVYREGEWEMIKRAPPEANESPTGGPYAHLEMKSRSLGSRVTAIGGALPDKSLAFCVLPTTLPNAAGLCKKSVDGLLTGQRPPMKLPPKP